MSVGRAGRGSAAWGLGVIVVAAVALRLIFFGGLRGWDDVEYLEAARGLLAGDLVPRSMFWARFGLILPLAVTRVWFGSGEHAAELVPLAYAIAEIGLAYALGRLYGGPAIGLTAAALLGLVPLAVLAASDLHTDLPLAVFWALTIYAVKRGEEDGPRRWLWFAGAGTALGAGYLTKEVALALVPVLALRLAWKRRGLRGYGMLAGAFAVVFVADLLWLWAVTGTPGFRYSPAITRLHTNHMLREVPGYAWMLAYPRALLDPLDRSFGYFAGLFYLALAGTVWGLRRGERAVQELALWWVPVLLLFNFAPLDRSFTRPLFYHFPRTHHPLLIPLALTAAVWLVRGLEGRAGVRSAVVVGLAALAAAGIWTTHFDARLWAAVARQAVPAISREPADTAVATDLTNTSLLRTLLPGRRDRIVWYVERDPAALPPGTLVLLDPLFLAGDLQHGHPAPPPVLSPPPGWEKVAEFARPQRTRLRALVLGWLGRPPAAAPPDSSGEPAVLWRIRPGRRG